MIAIINYGVGNLFSLESSFNAIGEDVKVTSDPEDLKRASRIILPGVGAFEDAAKKLKSSGLVETFLDEVKRGKPILGICLGMQLLFTKSFEFGEHEGLNLISGEVRYIGEVIPAGLKIPQIGWNALQLGVRSEELGIIKNEGEYVYFVHSYAAFCDEKFITATT
ncbi:MAG: imidazole glycerol phosphate synthase subunit HisH, partial [Synergistaceae bacterium]|nr:imidazole glycerol phosphate synthase subunit HisH [Synergistaceae bacterium]